ncbi:MAG: 4-hydroxy-tetrahydrodipicolinate synthase [Firmicutes bacterium]|nr:4-hydroxy-tetrahydrodipicolinate synthase [Bacillota bacterium]
MRDLGQLVTAMVTPFDKNLDVDYDKAVKLADFLADNGSDSLLVAGTTGESPAMNHEEKIKLFKVIKAAVGNRVPIIAGTGTNNTQDTIKYTREAEEIGADAALVVCPYYNKPPQEGIFRHFKAVAESTSLPIIVYNIPGRTGVNITPETMARLAEIPNIIADKEASGSAEQCSQMVIAANGMKAYNRYLPVKACVGASGPSQTADKVFSVYSGDDSLTLPMLSVGAIGVISVASHIAGKQMKEMITRYFEGKVSEALEIHNRLMPIFKGLFTVTNPVLIKSALRKIGFDCGGLRLPLVDATPEQETALGIAMREAGIC